MRRFIDSAQKLAALTGWRRNAALFTIGAGCVFLFAPFEFFPLLFLLLPLFFIMLDASPTARRATWDGFFFGYGYFMASTYWIAISLTVDAAKFGWMIPFCIFGLSAAFAVYFLLFGFFYHRFKFQSRFSNLIWFSILWVLIEYLRSIGTFGFAWNLIGYSLLPVVPLLQTASLTGVFGLSFLTLIFALAIVPYLSPKDFSRHFSLIAKLVFAVSLFYGFQHLSAKPIASTDNPSLRLVQANIPQKMKWDDNELNRIMYTQRVLSEFKSDAGQPDIIIWPETAIPLTLADDSDWTGDLMHTVPQGSTLISGIVREKGDDIYNAAIIFGEGGKIEAEYHKRQLVPFGEFIPLRHILPLDKIAPGPRDFSFGNKHDSLIAPHVPPVKPLICYEVIFPWLAHSSDRPRWLLTITNDAWFGNSFGPYQHFAMSRMRAVEQGLPLARVANTGITAMIDPHGKILRKLQLNHQGVLDIKLPEPLPPTLYAHYGECFILILLLTIYLLALRYRNTT